MTHFRAMTFFDWLQVILFNFLPFVVPGVLFTVVPTPDLAATIAMPSFLIGAVAFLAWQVTHFGYQCRACGRAFPAPKTWFFTSRFGYSLRLTCPDCGQTTWTRLVRRVGTPDPKDGVPEAQDLTRKLREQLRRGSGTMLEQREESHHDSTLRQ